MFDMSARKEEINLLPQKGFEATTAGRILAWILSTFRIIVIITELLVMVAFLSRFWLDAQNTDLNDQIRQKQAVLTASQDFEIRFKDIQERLKIFSELTSKKADIVNLISTITINLTPDIVTSEIVVGGEQIVISGVTPNEKSIEQFIVNLEETPNFKDVGIVEIKMAETAPGVVLFKVGATLEMTEGL